MIIKLRLWCLSILILCATLVSVAKASPPVLQTPSPVIYLADNLDEKDNLGWCIDTQGRGFGERLHAHSCKPNGGDVQFSFIEDTEQIQSVAFPEYCMANQPNEQTVFALVTCDTSSDDQRFVFDSDSKQIRLADDSTQCVVVGESSASAGPFLSRQLLLTNCADVDSALKEWVVSN